MSLSSIGALSSIAIAQIARQIQLGALRRDRSNPAVVEKLIH